MPILPNVPENFPAPTGGGAPTVVQSASDYQEPTGNVVFNANITAGNHIILFQFVFNGGWDGNTLPTDTLLNTYQPDQDFGNACNIFSAYSPAGGANTVDCTGMGGNGSQLLVIEVSGLKTTNWFDTGNNQQNVFVDGRAGNITLAGNDFVVVADTNFAGFGNYNTPDGAPYTELVVDDEGQSGKFHGYLPRILYGVDSGTINPGWTDSLTSYDASAAYLPA